VVWKAKASRLRVARTAARWLWPWPKLCFNPGQIFLDGRMGGRLADEQEMAARGQHGLADRLAGVEVVAEIDGIEPCIMGAMGRKRAPRRHAFAVLLVMAVLRHNEFGRKRHHPVVTRRHQRCRHHGVEIFDFAGAALARRATRAMQLRRAEIFGAVKGDQHVIAEPAERREPAVALKRVKRFDKQRIETLRPHPIEQRPDVVAARDFRHPEQRSAVRPAMPRPLRQVPLMGQEGRALHEEHRERRHADVRHRILAVLATAPVRQARAGVPQSLYQAVDRLHRQLESASRRF
jgi:hypothetical protein